MKMLIKKQTVVFMLILTGLYFLIAGCSQRPLDSLKEDQASLTYTESFWEQVEKNQPDLWQQAIKICREDNNKSKPNCKGIHDIQLFAHPKTYPRYGSGEGFGDDNLPVIKQ